MEERQHNYQKKLNRMIRRGRTQRGDARDGTGDEPAANAADPVLVRVPAERRGTLIADQAEDGYRFDITLQGLDETVFFTI